MAVAKKAASAKKSLTAWSPKLFADVVAAPDDDAPRLVYADWLTERGNPRGELIVVQCKIAADDSSKGSGNSSSSSSSSSTSNDELLDHESTLFTKHQRTWLRDAGLASAGTGVFRRGFIESVTLG